MVCWDAKKRKGGASRSVDYSIFVIMQLLLPLWGGLGRKNGKESVSEIL